MSSRRHPVRKRRFPFLIYMVTALLTIGIPFSTASDPISRKVIALYDSREKRDESNNEIRQMAELPLNYLGMIVTYWDIDDGLPPDTMLKGVRGFVTWFQDDEMAGAEEYCRWVSEQIRQGRKFIILHNFGAYRDRKTGGSVASEALDEAFGDLTQQLVSGGMA